MLRPNPAYLTGLDLEPQGAPREQPDPTGSPVSPTDTFNKEMAGVERIINSTVIRGER